MGFCHGSRPDLKRPPTKTPAHSPPDSPILPSRLPLNTTRFPSRPPRSILRPHHFSRGGRRASSRGSSPPACASGPRSRGHRAVCVNGTFTPAQGCSTSFRSFPGLLARGPRKPEGLVTPGSCSPRLLLQPKCLPFPAARAQLSADEGRVAARAPARRLCGASFLRGLVVVSQIIGMAPARVVCAAT